MNRDPRILRFHSNFSNQRSTLSRISITNWILLINLFVFIFAAIMKSIVPDFYRNLAISANSFFSFQKPWTLLTHMFMHAEFLHLFLNGFALFSLGSLCERIIGRRRYFLFYILSGIFAALLYLTFCYFFGGSLLGARIFGSPEAYAVGASGAIFAVAGLFVMLTPKLRFALIFFPFFSLPAYVMVPLVLLFTWAVSYSIGLGIGNMAHLGGLLAGIFYGYYLRMKYPRKVMMLSRYFS